MQLRVLNTFLHIFVSNHSTFRYRDTSVLMRNKAYVRTLIFEIFLASGSNHAICSTLRERIIRKSDSCVYLIRRI